MDYSIIKAKSRGYANHGWLEAIHSFSFAGYYNPDRMGFGMIRVLNDDKISGGMGFGMHPHENMEIITIPLEGGVRHRDNMGNDGVINSNEIQVMSAGTGVMHSEVNASPTDYLKLFQIWIMPNNNNVTPRYQQIKIELTANEFTQLVSPNADDSGAWINQDAWLHMGEFDQNQEINYELKNPLNGLYIMIVDGMVNFDSKEVTKRDAIQLTSATKVQMTALSKTKILLIETPIN